MANAADLEIKAKALVEVLKSYPSKSVTRAANITQACKDVNLLAPLATLMLASYQQCDENLSAFKNFANVDETVRIILFWLLLESVGRSFFQCNDELGFKSNTNEWWCWSANGTLIPKQFEDHERGYEVAQQLELLNYRTTAPEAFRQLDKNSRITHHCPERLRDARFEEGFERPVEA
ncbi:hypothetical protein PEBR_38566 [Penicillium brasilianum]|uniref:Uncharacterized protein n=1 Tax=Penicillium brasilianum TaxID=104259 RepID=A0A1S9RCG2_PENBI|nr:hypothetical protein PEBR_38566 [Penicillium brasilianum]